MLNTLGIPNTNTNTNTSTTSTAPAPALFIVVESVDMRRGIEGLSAHVEQHLRQSVCAGALYLFSNARRNRIKLLVWDATGVWLAQRRLHQGRFVWPERTPPSDGSDGSDGSEDNDGDSRAQPPYRISAEQWQWLVAGVDWIRLSARVEAQQHWRVG